MSNMRECRTWLAEQLRVLAENIEKQRVLAFSFHTSAEIIEVDPEEGDTSVRRALTGVHGLYVTYTEHPLAIDRVEPFHESKIGGTDGD